MSAPSASFPLHPNRQNRSRAEQIALVFDLLPGAILASLGVASLLAWGLAGYVPRGWLYLWFASVLLISGVRLLTLFAWRRTSAPTSPHWVWHLYVGAGVAGLTWGMAGFLLFPPESSAQLLITFALAGVATGGMTTLGILPRAYAAFLLAVVLPLSARLFMQQTETYTLMGLMTLVFISFLLTASHRIYLAYAESQRLRYDNEDLSEKQDALATAAITDALTGAYNRNMLNAALPSEMERARRYGLPLALILLDIDHFKHINDSYGHQVGDQALVGITKRICTQLREADLLFRWGGEEFLVLAPNINLAAAYQVADRMRREIEQSPIDPAGTITCSFGCSEFQVNDTQDSFIKRADAALYHAKENGRNRVEMV